MSARMRRPPLPVIAAAGLLATWAGWVEPRHLVVREEVLRLRGWPERLAGLRVGAIADIHGGVPHMGRGQIARAVAALNARRPDVLLLLGDYVDSHPLWRRRLAPEAVAEELAALRAPLGRLAVLGNHDWRRGGDRIWTALERVGIDVLENRAVAIDAPGGRLWVAGLADMRRRRPDVAATLAGIPPAEPVLMMSHDPDAHPRIPARVALTLAGHTHFGQVAIPGLRRLVIPSDYGERYARRHHDEDGRRLYVSSGLGTSGLPVRLLAPPEVVLLELQPDAGG